MIDSIVEAVEVLVVCIIHVLSDRTLQKDLHYVLTAI